MDSKLKPFKCDICPKSYTSKPYLENHEKTYRDEHQHRCKDCSKVFKYASRLKVHQMIHSKDKPKMAPGTDDKIKTFNCVICSKSYPTNGQLKKHEIIHSDEKPYQCNDCSKSFKHKSTLVSHKRIHTGEKPYPCNNCNKSFRTSRELK